MNAYIGKSNGELVVVRAKNEDEARQLLGAGRDEKVFKLSAFEAADIGVPLAAGVHAEALNKWLSERPNLTRWIRGD